MYNSYAVGLRQLTFLQVVLALVQTPPSNQC